MPRRSPGEIRRHLARRGPPGRITTINGLPKAATHQILAFERHHGLPRGEVAHALRAWREGLAPDLNGGFNCGGGTTSWRDMHARTLLEHVLHTLRRPARRQLAQNLAPLDERNLRATINDPCTRQDLPWWTRGILLANPG